MTADQKVKVIRTVCRECRAACGMLVHVKNGRAVRLEIDPHSPMAKDKLCWQSQKQEEIYKGTDLPLGSYFAG